jgi:hypothetical protein
MVAFRVKKGTSVQCFDVACVTKKSVPRCSCEAQPMYTHMLLTSIATSDVNSWHVGMDPEPDPRIRTTYFTDPDWDAAADSVKSTQA